MKRFLTFLLVATVLFASCSNNNSGSERKYEGEQVIFYGRLMEADAKWMSDTVWPEFTEKFGAEVIFKTFQNPAELPDMLELDKESGVATIFMTNDVASNTLVELGLVSPVSDYDTDGSYTALYTDAAIDGTMVGGEQYYTPLYLAAYSMAYSIEAVADAVANWESMKEGVNNSLKEYNGYGLPANYVLEADPNEWDNFDLAVVGYYWANTEYNGTTVPRMAHRARRYDGTYLELTAKAHQLGATEEDILSMDSQPIVDMFAWENYYVNEGIYNPSMWEEEWSGGGIYNAMSAGTVFLAFMHTQDAFTLHGTGTLAMPGYFANPDDMGFATSISGASLDVNSDGTIARTNESSSTKWFWNFGITEASPNKELSFDLIKWMMTGKEEYASHWLATGGQYVPLKAVAEDPSAYLSEEWMVNVFDVVNKDLVNAYASPAVPQFPEIGNLYIDAWNDIAREDNDSDIQGTLESVYGTAADEILQ